MSETPTDKPKRRARYKGTHPKKFHEKYKELNPEKYSADVEKVKSRGMTPVGTHIPICLHEIMDILKPQPGMTFVDATLGYGAHSEALLKKIIPNGKLIAFDQDSLERTKTEERLRKKITEWGEDQSCLQIGAINFSESWNYLRQKGAGKVDGVLADLGLSSMQIDTPERGFSFKVDAPLDLRMNTLEGVPARDCWGDFEVSELEELLRENSDEPRARQMAEQLFKDKPQSTLQLAESVRTVMKKTSRKIQEDEGDAPVRRVFQALRIYVNQEFSVLEKFLLDLPNFIKTGGRIAILTFHSGEDRRVKKSFQQGLRNGIYFAISEEPIRPSFEEQNRNPRSKSAKLRWAQRS
ncbi:16S rRNA (cytosine(1402)-N(4))-methyltransferase RsmH [bacterium]|nr:16S rRNA (cytosine(1402)-N(4))-methyltransferase RsmH [bacterium]